MAAKIKRWVMKALKGPGQTRTSSLFISFSMGNSTLFTIFPIPIPDPGSLIFLWMECL